MKALFISLLILLCGNLAISAQDKLQGLKNIDELQKQFSSDSGKVRLIALLSPT